MLSVLIRDEGFPHPRLAQPLQAKKLVVYPAQFFGFAVDVIDRHIVLPAG
jgi:hypothetical protein